MYYILGTMAGVFLLACWASIELRRRANRTSHLDIEMAKAAMCPKCGTYIVPKGVARCLACRYNDIDDHARMGW